MKSNKKGYTLIEILVVISIIGFIASIAMYTLNSARVKGRDAKRMADLEIIGKAIDLYYDKHNHYPFVNDFWGPVLANSFDNTKWNILQAQLSEFIYPLPVDPRNDAVFSAYSPGNHYTYTYQKLGPNPQEYDLITQLENKSSEFRCETKCWTMHSLAGGDVPWCGFASANCSGSFGFDVDIYANH